MINQKLEVFDGTFDVWIYLREAFVDWLFEVFIRSADRASQKKMYVWVTSGTRLYCSSAIWRSLRRTTTIPT